MGKAILVILHMGYSLVLSWEGSRSGSNEHGTRKPRNQGWRPWDNTVLLLYLDNKGPCPDPWAGPFLAEPLTWTEGFTELRGSPPSITRAHGPAPRPQNSMIKLPRALFVPDPLPASSPVLCSIRCPLPSTVHPWDIRCQEVGVYRRQSWRPLAVQIEKGAGFPVTCNVAFGSS